MNETVTLVYSLTCGSEYPNGTNVHITREFGDEGLTTDRVLEELEQFVLSCGWSFGKNKCLGIVDEDSY